MVKRWMTCAMRVKWAAALVLTAGLGAAVACTPSAPNPATPDPDVVLHPVDAPLRPPLTEAALRQAEAEMQQRIQADLDLLGLGKIGSVGSPISPDLLAYRQTWAETDPDIAPFLGTWEKEWDMLPHYFMTVFPSEVPGRVCLVRYSKQETVTVPFEVYDTPLEFSVAQVVEGQLLASNTQSARSLLRQAPVMDYESEFLATVEPTGNMQVYAAQRPPAIAPTWPAALMEQFRAAGCQE
ncbi:hypothetical protein [Leptolyngbya sp. O-77]|uniref:hypothetical protein n=1 Tax=Leptolyngbya sp. O-77 TaxID=1080068 RepID=UPI00074D3C38|nr:hypothetical protein [Leptolyngbya sp. O-77]BAU41455.1 hypothetical protein O77CONTIG1_01265 [Leptolyngbya sp. O-77]